MAPFQQANSQRCATESEFNVATFHAIFQNGQGAGPVVICWASEEAATVVHVSAVLQVLGISQQFFKCHAKEPSK